MGPVVGRLTKREKANSSSVSSLCDSLAGCTTNLSFFFSILFIFGCAGSLLLQEFFSSCGEWGLL